MQSSKSIKSLTLLYILMAVLPCMPPLAAQDTNNVEEEQYKREVLLGSLEKIKEYEQSMSQIVDQWEKLHCNFLKLINESLPPPLLPLFPEDVTPIQLITVTAKDVYAALQSLQQPTIEFKEKRDALFSSIQAVNKELEDYSTALPLDIILLHHYSNTLDLLTALNDMREVQAGIKELLGKNQDIIKAQIARLKIILILMDAHRLGIEESFQKEEPAELFKLDLLWKRLSNALKHEFSSCKESQNKEPASQKEYKYTDEL